VDKNDTSPRKPVWRRLLFPGIAVLLVAAVALVYFRGGFSGKKPQRFITEKVTRGNVVQLVSATGTLQPVVLSPVGAQVSGIVYKLHADYNDLVKKGQILVELDPALFQAAVRREEANVASAEATLAKARADAKNAGLAATRARALVEKHYISVAERDSAVAQEASAQAQVLAAEAGIKQARAALDKARLDLKNSVILSPVDGIVIARNVELGQAVVASFQAPNLYTIAEDLRKMQVLANVDEADIGHVRLGATAEFTVDAFRGRKFSARVSQIRNAAQTVSNVVTYIVVLELNNQDLLLRPGMTANVRLEVARRSDALLIPAAALRYKPRLDQIKGGAMAERGGRYEGGRRGPREGGEKGGEGRRRRGASGGDNPDGGASGGDKPAGLPAAELAEERGIPATVYTPSGDEVEPVHIVTGISDGMVTEVKEGLQEGQVIVVDAARPSGNGGSGNGAPGGAPRPPGMGGGGMRRGGF
jgi:HlyD family secretion protein